MWIVKNLSAQPLELMELGLVIAAKEYQDVDSLGREQVEASPAFQEALAQGALLTVSKDNINGETRQVLVSRKKLLEETKQYRERWFNREDLPAENPAPAQDEAGLFYDEMPEEIQQPTKSNLINIKDHFLAPPEELDLEGGEESVSLTRDELIEILGQFRKVLLADMEKLMDKRIPDPYRDTL